VAESASRATRPCLPLAVLAAAGCALRRDPPAGASGATIYELQNCANCHGEDGEGTTRGPALADVAAHWSREELADFLAAPSSWTERDAQLAALRASYSGAMSPYDNLTPDERLRLADHLLGVATPPR
jgi:mono/diheme cytochrome c family protein